MVVLRLLEQQLQAWRLTVQSEQGILEDRCSEMEVTMETLKEHNLCLQGMLTQVNTWVDTLVETQVAARVNKLCKLVSPTGSEQDGGSTTRQQHPTER